MTIKAQPTGGVPGGGGGSNGSLKGKHVVVEGHPPLVHGIPGVVVSDNGSNCNVRMYGGSVVKCEKEHLRIGGSLLGERVVVEGHPPLVHGTWLPGVVVSDDGSNCYVQMYGGSVGKFEKKDLRIDPDYEKGLLPRAFSSTDKNSRIVKSMGDRLWFMFCLLMIVIFWPFFLKVMCLKYKEFPEPVHNSSIGIRLEAAALYKTATVDMCKSCSSGGQDIFYDITVDIENFKHAKDARSPSVIQLYASYDKGKPRNFFVTNTVEIKDGLTDAKTQQVKVCNTNTSYVKDEEGTCCFGRPGITYLVACVLPGLPSSSDVSQWDKLTIDQDNKFDSRCVAIDSLCGSPCGFDTTEPEYCNWKTIDGEVVRGTIPGWLLMREKNLPSAFYNKAIVSSPQFSENSVTEDFLHICMMVFMTITVISVWISFLAGVGEDKSAPPPDISSVNEYHRDEKESAKSRPLVLASFSISASESPMMIVRNLVGKLQAWCNEHHEVILKLDEPKSADEDRPKDEVMLVDIFQDEGHRSGAFAIWDTFTELLENLDFQAILLFGEQLRNMDASDTKIKPHKHDNATSRKLKENWEAKKVSDKIMEYLTEKENVDQVEETQQEPSTLGRVNSWFSRWGNKSGKNQVTIALEKFAKLELKYDLAGSKFLNYKANDILNEAFGNPIFFPENPLARHLLKNAIISVQKDIEKDIEEKISVEGSDDKDDAAILPERLKKIFRNHTSAESSIIDTKIKDFCFAWHIYPLLEIFKLRFYWKEFKDFGSEDEDIKGFFRAACKKWANMIKEDEKGFLNGSKDPFNDEIIRKAFFSTEDADARRAAAEQEHFSQVVSTCNSYTTIEEWKESGDYANWKKNFSSRNEVVVENLKTDIMEWSRLYHNPDKWPKLDFDHSKQIEFTFFKKEKEENWKSQLHMIYSARAKVEETCDKFFPSQDIVQGVVVRLKSHEEYKIHHSNHDLYKNLNISTEDASKCVARVKDVESHFTSFNRVELTDMSKEMMKRIIELKEIPGNKFKIEIFRGSAFVPFDILLNLRSSRGKAGGMNYAMDVLERYLLSENESVPEKWTPERPGTLLFAVFDCRHMGQQGYWETILPYFFKYKPDYTNGEYSETLEINNEVCFTQFPQYFADLPIDEDFFDMRNDFGFRYANTIRNGVSAVTSCGTNACWNIELRFKESSPGEKKLIHYRFNTDTMIEDTASSHEAVLQGRRSIYIYERKVIGAKKNSADYLAAIFRWSTGAVQLNIQSWYQCPRFDENSKKACWCALDDKCCVAGRCGRKETAAAAAAPAPAAAHQDCCDQCCEEKNCFLRYFDYVCCYIFWMPFALCCGTEECKPDVEWCCHLERGCLTNPEHEHKLTYERGLECPAYFCILGSPYDEKKGYKKPHCNMFKNLCKYVAKCFKRTKPEECCESGFCCDENNGFNGCKCCCCYDEDYVKKNYAGYSILGGEKARCPPWKTVALCKYCYNCIQCALPLCWCGCCHDCFNKEQGCARMILNYIMFPVLDALWPWIFLTIFVAPFILIIVALQAININLRTPKDMIDNKFCNGWLDNYSCDKGNKYREDFAIMSLMWNGYFCTYASWTVFIALLAYNFRVFASYVILLENTTYFCNSCSAFFWCALPVYMTFTGKIPFNYDPSMLTFMGLWLELWMFQIFRMVKRWAPIDDQGRGAPEGAITKAQQMYFINAPLHIFAIYKGLYSGCSVRWWKKDQSFWNSFANKESIKIAKMWVISLAIFMSLSIILGVVNLIKMGFRVELIIGLFISTLIFSIIYEPIIAIFFQKAMQKRKQKERTFRCSFQAVLKSVRGNDAEFSTRGLYLGFWITLFGLTVWSDKNGVFRQRWM